MGKASEEKKPHRYWKVLAPGLVKGMDSVLDLGDKIYEEVVKRDLLPRYHHNQIYRLEGVIEEMTTLEN